jgi:hypothetical protein
MVKAAELERLTGHRVEIAAERSAGFLVLAA